MNMKFSVGALKMVLKYATAFVFITICGCSVRSESQEEKKATASFLKGDFVQTVTDAQVWSVNDPNNPVPHALLNLVYCKLPSCDDAMKAECGIAFSSFSRANRVKDWAALQLSRYGENVYAYWLKGLAYEIMQDNQAAVSTYKKSIAFDPTFKQGYESLGNLYLLNGSTEKAFAVYSDLLAKHPNYSAAYGHIATIYVTKNDRRKAVEYFEKAVELDPKDLIGQYNLAVGYLVLGQNEKAVATLQAVVNLDPNGGIGQDAKKKLNKLRQ